MIFLPVLAFTRWKNFIWEAEGILLRIGLAFNFKLATAYHLYIFNRCSIALESLPIQCATNSRGLSLNHTGTFVLYRRYELEDVMFSSSYLWDFKEHCQQKLINWLLTNVITPVDIIIIIIIIIIILEGMSFFHNHIVHDDFLMGYLYTTTFIHSSRRLYMLFSNSISTFRVNIIWHLLSWSLTYFLKDCGRNCVTRMARRPLNFMSLFPSRNSYLKDLFWRSMPLLVFTFTFMRSFL